VASLFEQDLATGVLLGKAGLPAMAYAAGAQLGRGVGGLFGLEDKRTAAFKDLDFSSPEGLIEASKTFLDMGDYDRALKFYEAASDADYKKAKAAAEGIPSMKVFTPLSDVEVSKYAEELIQFARKNNIEVDASALRRKEGPEWAQLVSGAEAIKQLKRNPEVTGLTADKLKQLETALYKEILSPTQAVPSLNMSDEEIKKALGI